MTDPNTQGEGPDDPGTNAAETPGHPRASKRERVYTVIQAIPPGRVASYGAIARLAGLPGRARWVGRLLAELPTDSRLPWFRVINAAGRITFAPRTARFRRQRQALLADGVAVPVDGRIDLARYGWPGAAGD